MYQKSRHVLRVDPVGLVGSDTDDASAARRAGSPESVRTATLDYALKPPDHDRLPTPPNRPNPGRGRCLLVMTQNRTVSRTGPGVLIAQILFSPVSSAPGGARCLELTGDFMRKKTRNDRPSSSAYAAFAVYRSRTTRYFALPPLRCSIASLIWSNLNFSMTGLTPCWLAKSSIVAMVAGLPTAVPEIDF